MKKIISIIFIFLLAISNSYGAWLSNDKNKMTLFGIGLTEHQDTVESTPCYKYENMLNVKRLDLMEFRDDRDWKNLIYKDSKVPVARGCVKPLISNDDFFNFYIRVYPKTKEIYEISAVYKKTFIHSDRDLLGPFSNAKTDDEIRKGSTLFGTECKQLAKTLRGVVVSSHKEKGFKVAGEGYMIKGGSSKKPKYKFKITSDCRVNDSPFGDYLAEGEKYNPDKAKTYFVSIEISNVNSDRRMNEESELKDEAAKKNLDKSGL
tara:strand:+ start:171 stop:956 length:786 start_codon:yes stop_codon:yes gene_type:complete